jgi:hypothetical protein
LGFTNETVPEGQHICYLYNNDTERHDVISRFLESGLSANEKVIYLVDTMTPGEMIERLESVGVDVRMYGSALNVADAPSSYCPNGAFDCSAMLQYIRDEYAQGIEEGYDGVRGSGEMSWCLNQACVEESALMEYEAELNNLVETYPVTVCCQYDTRRFDGNMIMNMLAIHPVTIVHGQLVKNPYYIGPEQFLEKYRARVAG